MPLTAEPDYAIFEYACHEGNYAVPNARQRVIDARATAGNQQGFIRPSATTTAG